jgi:hypothetical protein
MVLQRPPEVVSGSGDQVTQGSNAPEMERPATAEGHGLVRVARRPEKIPDLVMSPAKPIGSPRIPRSCP